MATATKARTTSTTTAAPAATFEAAPDAGPTSTDEFLEMPAPGAKLQMAFADLDASFRASLARRIDVAAPNPGTSTEIAATVRVPLEPPLWVTGKVDIEAERTADGVTASLTGGLGLSLGEDGLFVDLMANGALEATGKTAASTAQLLVLAIESAVRAVPDGAFTLGGRSIVLAALVTAARKAGMPVADMIADSLWGAGHAAALMAAMQDGESAAFAAGLSVDGSAGVDDEDGPEIAVEGSAGVVDRHTIEKSGDDPATTKEVAAALMNLGIAIGPVSGEVELDVPLDKSGGGSLRVSGALSGEAKELGDLSPYVSFLLGAIAVAQQYLGGTADPAATSAASTLASAREVVRQTLTGAENMILLELGKAGLPVDVGVELSLELDFAKRTGTIALAATTSMEVATPDGSQSFEGGQKVQLGKDLEFALPKP